MKKGVNLVWILFAIVAVELLIISFMGCVDETAPLFVDDPNSDIVKSGRNLLAFTIIPTLFSLFVFLKRNKALSIIGSVLLFFQAIIVTLSDKILNFIDAVFTNIGSIFHNYSINSIGVIAIVLCWLLFVISLIFVYRSLIASNVNMSTHQRNTKILSVVLTVVFIIASTPLFVKYMAMLLCIVLGIQVYDVPADMSLLLWTAILTAVLAVLIAMIIFSVRKSNKTDSRKYLWISVVAILMIVFIQIVF